MRSLPMTPRCSGMFHFGAQCSPPFQPNRKEPPRGDGGSFLRPYRLGRSDVSVDLRCACRLRVICAGSRGCRQRPSRLALPQPGTQLRLSPFNSSTTVDGLPGGRSPPVQPPNNGPEDSKTNWSCRCPVRFRARAAGPQAGRRVRRPWERGRPKHFASATRWHPDSQIAPATVEVPARTPVVMGCRHCRQP